MAVLVGLVVGEMANGIFNFFFEQKLFDPRCSRCETIILVRCVDLFVKYLGRRGMLTSGETFFSLGVAGNPLKSGFLDEPCYNLVYLEVAGCRLTTLPEGLARLVPNLRALNLNYNFLEDAEALAGLGRLRKLTIIGSRLKGTKSLIRLLQRMPEVEILDCRYVIDYGNGRAAE